uniref:Uncharacterized protein n=1 Tax=Zea mays TaxID=4577 RepID=A0A804PK76_MAIZE
MSSSGPLPAGTHQTRNRAGNRRKSGDRADKANYSYNNDGEKSNVPSLKNLPPIVHHETFFSNVQNDYNQTGLVPLEGCSASEASQLLSDRWTAAINMYNDQTIDPSDELPRGVAPCSGRSYRICVACRHLELIEVYV